MNSVDWDIIRVEYPVVGSSIFNAFDVSFVDDISTFAVSTHAPNLLKMYMVINRGTTSTAFNLFKQNSKILVELTDFPSSSATPTCSFLTNTSILVSCTYDSATKVLTAIISTSISFTNEVHLSVNSITLPSAAAKIANITLLNDNVVVAKYADLNGYTWNPQEVTLIQTRYDPSPTKGNPIINIDYSSAYLPASSSIEVDLYAAKMRTDTGATDPTSCEVLTPTPPTNPAPTCTVTADATNLSYKIVIGGFNSDVLYPGSSIRFQMHNVIHAKQFNEDSLIVKIFKSTDEHILINSGLIPQVKIVTVGCATGCASCYGGLGATTIPAECYDCGSDWYLRESDNTCQ